MKALVFGEVLWDVIEGTPHLGGAPLNLGAHLARLGAEVTLLSAVGDDDLGRRAAGHAAEYGLHTEYLSVHPDRPTGTVDVTVDGAGKPDYIIHEGVAWDSIALTEDQLECIANTTWDVVYIGTLAQRTDLNREILSQLLTRTRRNHVFFDVNLRQAYYSKDVIERSLLNTTILKINDDEADVLARMLFGLKTSTDAAIPIEATAKRLLDSYGLEVVVITRGGEGAYIHAADRSFYVQTKDVEIADTVGAGDSFSAAFLSAYLAGRGLVIAANQAARLADFVVSRHGAIPDYPEDFRSLILGD